MHGVPRSTLAARAIGLHRLPPLPDTCRSYTRGQCLGPKDEDA